MAEQMNVAWNGFENVIESEQMQPLVDACDELSAQARELQGEDSPTIGDYAGLIRIRRTEEELYRLKLAGDVVPNIHQCVGQEAVSIGGVATLEPTDLLTSNYRGRGHAIAKGAPLRQVVAEVSHRETGLSRGRSGPMHMIDPNCNLLFESAIVGGAAPLAVGAALASVRRGTGAVTMTIFGEGTTAQGSVHEAINLAGALKLPVIFVLENNRYSEMTPASATTALADFSWRALGHGVPALSADGNSVPIMRSATRSALEWTRSGRGPVLIEARTYRLVGHYGGDPGAYRPPGELEEAERLEPIGRTGEELIQRGASEDDLQRARDEVEQEVQDAVNFALESPLSDPAGASQHVYKEEA